MVSEQCKWVGTFSISLLSTNYFLLDWLLEDRIQLTVSIFQLFIYFKKYYFICLYAFDTVHKYRIKLVVEYLFQTHLVGEDLYTQTVFFVQ